MIIHIFVPTHKIGLISLKFSIQIWRILIYGIIYRINLFNLNANQHFCYLSHSTHCVSIL